MKKTILAILTLALLASCDVGKKVSVTNQTGVDFTGLYASRPTDGDWGAERSGALANGSSAEISVEQLEETDCAWDIGGQTADGTFYSQREIDVCTTNAITLTAADID